MIYESAWPVVVAESGEALLRSHPSAGPFDGHSAAAEATESLRRGLLARLLVDAAQQTRVIVDRRELGRLLGKRRDDIAWEVFSPRLQVHDFLEDVIEYLEAEMVGAASRSAGEGAAGARTCWFTTPGVDFDVVLQTLQQVRNRRFLGLLFGAWPHGSAVYALGEAAWPCDFELSRELLRGTPTMTEEEAFRALSSCRI